MSAASVGFIVTSYGVIVRELAAQVGRDATAAASRTASNYLDAQALADVAQNTIRGNGLQVVRTIGSAATGILFSPAGAFGGPVVALGAGFAAGEAYESLFDSLMDLGSQAGISFYELTHSEYDPNALDPAVVEEARLAWEAAAQFLSFSNNGASPETRDSAWDGLSMLMDPVAIDLNGDGVQTVAVDDSNPIMFDHNGDGDRTGTGWISADDAWLVRDLNGNGVVDSGREMFGVGTVTRVQNGQEYTAPDGFFALDTIDSNGDGVIDQSDASFAGLSVWRDANQDGVSQADEIQSLTAAGVSGISLNETVVRADQGNGNIIGAESIVDMADGSQTTAAALDLADNPYYREFANQAPINSGATGLPYLSGSGWVRNIQAAATANPALQTAINTFLAASDPATRRSLVESIVTEWANSSGQRDMTVAEGGLPARYDYQGTVSGQSSSVSLNTEVYALEMFTGTRFLDVDQNQFVDGTHDPVPIPGDTTGGSISPTQTIDVLYPAQNTESILLAYQQLLDDVYESMYRQTTLPAYLDTLTFDIQNGELVVDSSVLQSGLQSRFSQNPQAGVVELTELIRYGQRNLEQIGFDSGALLNQWLDGLSANDPVLLAAQSAGLVSSGQQGTAFGDVWLGGLQTTFWSGQGRDTLFGSGANEHLNGEGNDDYIAGGGGNDTLNGDAGNDVLLGGAGHDTLFGDEGDLAPFGEAPGDDYLDGGSGNDGLVGGLGNDILIGGEGDDGLYGESGDDVYVGGIGDDYLEDNSESSSDIYLYSSGDGSDTISDDGGTDKLVFTDLTPDDIASVQGDEVGDVVVTLNDDSTIRLTGAVGGASGAAQSRWIETIEFSDGTVWDTADIEQQMNMAPPGLVLVGDAGDNYLYGEETNDSFTGGAGNDVLDDISPTSSDTYYYSSGDGSDYIYDGGGDDKLVLTDMSATDVASVQSGFTDEVLINLNDGNAITIGWGVDWMGDPSSGWIETIEFGDGSFWDSAAIAQRMVPQPDPYAFGMMSELSANTDMLVDAMAGFAPSLSGQTDLSAAMNDEQAPALAANWQ